MIHCALLRFRDGLMPGIARNGTILRRMQQQIPATVELDFKIEQYVPNCGLQRDRRTVW